MSTRDNNQAPFDWAPPVEYETERRTTPVSAPMGTNGEGILLPQLPEPVAIGYADGSMMRLKYGHTDETLKACVSDAIAQRDERIRHLECELEQSKAAFQGSENARKDAERARGRIGSIDDYAQFHLLLNRWMELRDYYQDDQADPVKVAWGALIAYIDGRTAGTAWINVDERLPARGQKVIAYRPTAEQTQDPPISIVRYTACERESWQGVKHGFDCICHPTHWMSLPAAPTPITAKDE